MDQNNAAPGRSTTQEVGAEARAGDGSELERDCLSASDETQQQPNAAVHKEDVGEANKQLLVTKRRKIEGMFTMASAAVEQ